MKLSKSEVELIVTLVAVRVKYERVGKERSALLALLAKLAQELTRDLGAPEPDPRPSGRGVRGKN